MSMLYSFELKYHYIYYSLVAPIPLVVFAATAGMR